MNYTPYVGLAPFGEEDADRFFGRKELTELVVNYLQAERLTILYGASGVGKSSLLSAGVIPDLRRVAQGNVGRSSPEFYTAIFNDWSDEPIAKLLRQIYKVLKEYGQNVTQPVLGGPNALCENLRQWTTQLGSGLIVILDQFEEHFLYASQNSSTSFGAQFKNALNDSSLPINVLISIREDALAKLDRYREQVPSLFQNMLRVDHLTPTAAQSAIVEPIDLYNKRVAEDQAMRVEPGLIAAVLGDVSTGAIRQESSDSLTGETSSSARVETPYLQLVMSRLWREEITVGSRVLQLSTYNRIGGAKSIVDGHLSLTIGHLSAEQRGIAAQIFRYLVTPSGTKIAQSVTDLAEYSMIPESEIREVLDELSSMRILRTIAPPPEQPDVLRYEIFHDVLAEPINSWWKEYEADERMKKMQEETARQKQLDRARSARFVAAVLSVLLIMMIGLTALAFQMRSTAVRERGTAVHEKANADEVRRQLAEKNEKLVSADKARVIALQLAEAAKASAEKQKKLAERRALDLAGTLGNLKQANEIDNLNRQGLEALDRDNIDEARPIFERLSKDYEKSGNHLGEAWAHIRLGTVFSRKGWYFEAVYEYSRARELQGNSISGSEIASTLNHIAQAYKDEGDYGAADINYAKMLAILGCDRSRSASCMNIKSDMADLYHEQGRDALAEVEQRENELDDLDEEIDKLSERDDAASLAKIKQKKDRREKLKQEEDDLKALSKKRYPQAESLYNEVVAFRERTLSPSDKQLADIYGSLAALYEDSDYPGSDSEKNKEEAKKLRAIVQAIGKNRPIQDRYDKAEVDKIGRLAKVYAEQGKPGMAEKLFDQVETAAKAATGSDDKYLLAKLDDAAEFFYNQKIYSKAEQYLVEKMLPIHDRVSTDEDKAEFYNVVANVLAVEGKYSNAESFALRCVEIRKKGLQATQRIKDNSFEYIDAVRMLASLYERDKKPVMAEENYKLALETGEKAFGRDAGINSVWARSLGKFYFGQNRYDEAEPQFERARRVFAQLVQTARRAGGSSTDFDSRLLSFEITSGFYYFMDASLYIETLANLTTIKLRRKDFVEAESLCKERIDDLEWLRKYLPRSRELNYLDPKRREEKLNSYEVFYAEALEAYEGLLRTTNRIPEADEMKKQAQRVREQKHPTPVP